MGGELSYADLALYLRRYAPAHDGQHMSTTLYGRISSFHDLGVLANFAKKDGLPSMTTMNIPLPDALKTFVDAQVAERGYGTSSEYGRELIRKDQDRQHLRGRLLAGASSQPAQTADSAYFDALRDRVALGFVDALEKAYAYIGSHMPH